MLAYEREADQALVIAAGVQEAWLDDGSDVAVDELRTHHGTVGYTLRRSAPDALALSLRGALVPPPGGIVLRPPVPGRLVWVEVDGVAVDDFLPDEVTVRARPLDVVLRYRSQR